MGRTLELLMASDTYYNRFKDKKEGFHEIFSQSHREIGRYGPDSRQ